MPPLEIQRDNGSAVWEKDRMPQRTHAEDSHIDRLIEGIATLSESVRQMTASWAVERGQLISDVREMRSDIATIKPMISKVNDIESFIQGDGKDHHVGQRLHGIDIRLEHLTEEVKKLDGVDEKEKAHAREIRELKSFQTRLMWAVVSASLVAAASFGWHFIDLAIGSKK